MNNSNNTPWYKTGWGILLVTLLFPILVPYLFWKETKYPIWAKGGVIALCILLIVSCNNYYREARAKIEVLNAQAIEHIDSGDLTEAKGLLEEALDIGPNSTAVALYEEITQLEDPNFVSNTLVEMTEEEYALLQQGELTKVYFDYEAFNAIAMQRLLEAAPTRSELLANIEKEKQLEQEREEERQRLEAEAAEHERIANEKEERNKNIKSQFNAWDGSHINLTRLIKRTMNDPNSFEHVGSSYIDNGDHLVVLTQFRGKNAFGGVVTNSVKAKVDLEGNIIEIIEQY